MRLTLKAIKWPKLLLCGGLLLVLGQGAVKLPEVESRLYPSRLWSTQIRCAQRNLIIAEMKLAEVEATLQALRDLEKSGLVSWLGTGQISAYAWQRAWQRAQAKKDKYGENKLTMEQTLQRWQRLRDNTSRTTSEKRVNKHSACKP